LPENDGRHPAISLSDFLLSRHVGRPVSDEPGQLREMARFTACLRQHLRDVCKNALDLDDKIITDQFAARGPTDLTGDENLTSVGGDAGNSLLASTSSLVAGFRYCYCS